MKKLIAAILFFCSLGLADLKEQLSLFADFSESEKIVSVSQKGTAELELQLLDSNSQNSRNTEVQVPEKIMEKLKVQAGEEGISWTMVIVPSSANSEVSAASKTVDTAIVPSGNNITADSEEAATAESDVNAAGEDKKGIMSASKFRNRLKYVTSQSIFSSYVYGLALPISLELEEKAAAAYLLSLPISFGVLYYLNKDRTIYDSHLYGVNYFSFNSIALTYLTSLAIMGPDVNAFRVGSIALLASYPYSVYMGNKHGDKYLQEPGRIGVQTAFAYTFGIGAFTLTPLWGQAMEDEEEIGVRLMTLSMLGAGIGGHFLANKYREGEYMPGGIGAGIGTFTAFGGILGLIIAADAEVDDATAFSTITTGSLGLGFLAGTQFFKNKYDTQERAGYMALGATAGGFFVLGSAILLDVESEGFGLVYSTMAGAAVGYTITRAVTSSLVESPRSKTASLKEKPKASRLSLNLVPMPVPYKTKEKMEIAWTLPGIQWKF